MKIYTVIVTSLLVVLLGFQAVSYIVEKRNMPYNIAIFNDFDGARNVYKLQYSKNGDLIFSTVRSNPSIPKLIYWDYYGSTEVKKYKWINKNTIEIEMQNSRIKIRLPNFKVDNI